MLFTVKTHATGGLGQALKPLLRRDSIVFALQNGVDRADEIGRLIGRDKMLAGAVYMEACVESPGVMRYLSGARRVVFGEPSGPITPRVHGLHAGQCRREYGVLGHFCGAKHLDHPPRYGGVVAKTLFTRKPPRLSPERLAGQWGNPRRPIGWAAAPGSAWSKSG